MCDIDAVLLLKEKRSLLSRPESCLAGWLCSVFDSALPSALAGPTALRRASARSAGVGSEIARRANSGHCLGKLHASMPNLASDVIYV